MFRCGNYKLHQAHTEVRTFTLTKIYACRRFYSVLNSLGLYNKNAKILFLVSHVFVLPGQFSAAGFSVADGVYAYADVH